MGLAVLSNLAQLLVGCQAPMPLHPPLTARADMVIQNFFKHPNYHYYMVYPPQFTEEYMKWWDRRKQKQTLSIAFTSLLLRACACSLQYLEIELRPRIAELGDLQTLTEKLHDAACKVNDTMTPGEGGLFQVQQLIMMSWWFKSETRFHESWHALAQAYLSAQELGGFSGRPVPNTAHFLADHLM
jgi:hypothetical protein